MTTNPEQDAARGKSAPAPELSHKIPASQPDAVASAADAGPSPQGDKPTGRDENMIETTMTRQSEAAVSRTANGARPTNDMAREMASNIEDVSIRLDTVAPTLQLLIESLGQGDPDLIAALAGVRDTVAEQSGKLTKDYQTLLVGSRQASASAPSPGIGAQEPGSPAPESAADPFREYEARAEAMSIKQLLYEYQRTSLDFCEAQDDDAGFAPARRNDKCWETLATKHPETLEECAELLCFVRLVIVRMEGDSVGDIDEPWARTVHDTVARAEKFILGIHLRH